MSGVVEGDKAAKYLEFAANMTRACYQVRCAAVGREERRQIQAPGWCTLPFAILSGRSLSSTLYRTPLHLPLQLYNQTTTGLGAERIDFQNMDSEPATIQVMDRHYYQRPEVSTLLCLWLG